MRTFTLSFLVLFFIALTLYAEDKPISGQNFTLR
jgi:hypothetical protein